MTLRLLFVLVVLVPEAAFSQDPRPTLSLAGCTDALGQAGDRVCIPVNLVTRGELVASSAFTLEYALDAMRMPGRSSDVLPGPVLMDDQNVAAVVKEDEPTGLGTVRVLVTPPLASLPIASSLRS